MILLSTRYLAAAVPRLLLTTIILVVLFLTPGLATQTPSEKVTKTRDDETETDWLIERPYVTKSRKTYKDDPAKIEFKKYDEVVVTGGGCVDTGAGIRLLKLLGLIKTWKQYVDPVGNNSDRLYHGRISIPGATDGLIRISSIEGQHLVINKFPAHDEENRHLYLQLGYEDDNDNYHDSGYLTKWDQGTQNQCGPEQKVAVSPDGRMTGGAWVQIKIIHHNDPATAPPSPDPRAPVDLWWDSVDENFLPYNPDWWLHHIKQTIPNSTALCNGFEEGPHDRLLMAKSPQCTTWDPDVDEGNLKSFFCHVDNPPLLPKSKRVHGHVNWGAVTYEGNIYFDVSNNAGYSPCFPGEFVLPDTDYDWLLDTGGQRGISTANVADSEEAAGKRGALPNGVRALALEFSSRETVDIIRRIEGKQSNTWWGHFHDNVDGVDGDCAAARNSVKGKKAIIIGLMGFDNEHEKHEKKSKEEDKKDEEARQGLGARVELHPVWGLAINVTEKGDNEDRWIIFARNWGDEGSCSNGWSITRSKWQHWLPLPENEMKFFLPGTPDLSQQAKPDFQCGYYHPDGSAKCEPLHSAAPKVFSNGVLLTIKLFEPEDQGLIWGEVRIPRKN